MRYHYPTNKEIRELQQLIPEKIPFTKLQITLQLISTGILLMTMIALWHTWPYIGAQVPIHFSLNGQVDGWGNKTMLLLLLFLAAGIYLLLTLLLFYPKSWNIPYRYHADNVVWTIQQIRSMMIWLNTIITGFFGYLTVYSILLSIIAAPPDHAVWGIMVIFHDQIRLPPFALLIVILAIIMPIIYYWRKLKGRLVSENDFE